MKNAAEVAVLRWGHRPLRDARLTTHVALTARALGAKHFILADTSDTKLMTTITKVTENWGGPFSFTMGTPWKRTVHEWRERRHCIVVHLTAYGENIETSDVIDRIKNKGKDILVIVGSQKVPSDFFSKDVSNFNVAVGNQPHSECASLAIFLDRFFEGKSLSRDFEGARTRIVPRKRGKEIISSHKKPIKRFKSKPTRI